MGILERLKSLKGTASKGLDVAEAAAIVSTPISTPVVEPIPVPISAVPVVVEETPEQKLQKELASMDIDTLIEKVLGVPRLPGDAMVMSKLLSSDKFLKWLKIHVLRA